MKVHYYYYYYYHDDDDHQLCIFYWRNLSYNIIVRSYDRFQHVITMDLHLLHVSLRCGLFIIGSMRIATYALMMDLKLLDFAYSCLISP